MFENIFEGGETMRKFKVLSTVCLILLLTASTAFGAVSSTPDIEFMAEYYSTASASISLSGSTAEVTGKIVGRAGKTTVENKDRDKV